MLVGLFRLESQLCTYCELVDHFCWTDQKG